MHVVNSFKVILGQNLLNHEREFDQVGEINEVFVESAHLISQKVDQSVAYMHLELFCLAEFIVVINL